MLIENKVFCSDTAWSWDAVCGWRCGLGLVKPQSQSTDSGGGATQQIAPSQLFPRLVFLLIRHETRQRHTACRRNLTCRLSAWLCQGESSSNICSHLLLLRPVYMKFSTFTNYLNHILKNENPCYLCCINETMLSKTSGNPCHRHLPKLTSMCSHSQVVFWPGLQQTCSQSLSN